MNAQTKHTPGPWRAETVKPVPVNTKAIVISAADGPVAFATVENAPLIASAPELLEALKELIADADLSGVTAHYKGRGFDESIEKARAAIAKVTGEQP